MKKDKEWLKKQLSEYRETYDYNSGNGWMIGVSKKELFDLIDRLDELEITKEAILEYATQNELVIFEKEKLNEEVQRMVNEATKQDEPERVVIPTFVAEYIERYKDARLSLSEWFETVDEAGRASEHERKTFKWIYGNDWETCIQREDILHSAIRHGYEVEKAPKWVVKSEKGYLTAFNIGKVGNFLAGYNGMSDTEFAIRFDDKARADGVAVLVGGTVEEVKE